QDGFRKGCDLYFDRHDGQAVTTDDFVKALEDANDANFEQFKRWYSQAGTPVVEVSSQYIATEKKFTLTFKQSCPSTPNQETKEPFHIPIRVGLLNSVGHPCHLGDMQGNLSNTRVLELTEQEQTFVFTQFESEPVPSIFRGFSAPIKLIQQQTLDTQLFLFKHDTDSFNRWEAGQNCLSQLVFNAVKEIQNKTTLSELPEPLIDAFRLVLQQPLDDLAYQSLLLSLPTKAYLAEQMDVVDVDALYQAHRHIKQALAGSLKDLWLANYQTNHLISAGISQTEVAQRSFKNLCLDYLMTLNDERITELCTQQFTQAQNMTDQIAALGQLSHLDSAQNTAYFNAFYQQWKDEDLVIDKWFTLQACSEKAGALDGVKQLLEHPDFDIKTPNRVRSLIGAFASANPLHFNAADGSGYTFIADSIITLDAINPQVAARLANSLSRWKKFDTHRQQLIKQQLTRIQSHTPISQDVLEIVTRSLKA
ncbi:MAG: DUF3458 domain-containing protein, partial [Cycloclasticus sp.]|nr:DUF3458 domain-containing protein [Cycloclasticus sp.]